MRARHVIQTDHAPPGELARRTAVSGRAAIAPPTLSMRSFAYDDNLRVGASPGPKETGGENVRPLREGIEVAGGAQTLSATGKSASRPKAKLLVQHRPCRLCPAMQAPPLCNGLPNPHRAQPLSPRRPARPPLLRVRAADALRATGCAPVLRCSGCVVSQSVTKVGHRMREMHCRTTAR